MSTERVVAMVCDLCRGRWYTAEVTVKAARMAATLNSWGRRGRSDICWECIEEQAADTPIQGEPT